MVVAAAAGRQELGRSRKLKDLYIYIFIYIYSYKCVCCVPILWVGRLLIAGIALFPEAMAETTTMTVVVGREKPIFSPWNKKN